MDWIIKNLQLLAWTGATIGLFLNFYKLKTTHDWYRRNQASKMIAEWNQKTSKHRKAIENIEPGIIDKINDKIIDISRERAEKIYRSKPDQVDDWELRFHFVELLNYFEYVSSSYWNRVSDKSMIDESFQNTMIAWHDLLHNFIKVFKENRKSNSWKPYTDLIDHWTSSRRGFRIFTGIK